MKNIIKEQPDSPEFTRRTAWNFSISLFIATLVSIVLIYFVCRLYSQLPPWVPFKILSWTLFFCPTGLLFCLESKGEEMNDNTRVFNGKCEDFMKDFQDGYFELAIVDPPYGLDEDSHRQNERRSNLAQSKRYHDSVWRQAPPDENYFRELRRISKNMIVWGANHFISSVPLDSPCWIVWDKDNGENDFADCELALTTFGTAVRKFTYRWQGMLQGNMKEKENRIHPTQKPVQLYKWLLKNYAKEGDKILDTHLGSQSSRIAAFDMGFNFTGYELDKDYFDSGNKRFEQHKSQLKIFQP